MVEHSSEYLLRVVNLATILRDDRKQGFVSSFRVVVARLARRHFPHVCGKIGKKSTNLLNGVFLALRKVHDDAVLNLNTFVPEVLFGDRPPRRLFDHFGSSDEYLTGIFDHDVKVAQTGLDSGQPSH